MSDSHSELSERELEILRLVATGASNKEIAQQLFISTNTVKVHLRNIFAKIGAASRTEAAMYAVKVNLIPSPLQKIEEIEGDDFNSMIDEMAVHSTSEVGQGQKKLFRQRSFLSATLAIVGLLMISLIFGISALLLNPRMPLGVNPTQTELRKQILAPMPTARFGLAVAVYENQIFAISGTSYDGITGVVERYDPLTDSWETLASKPQPVSDVQAAVIAGRIFVPGGELSTGQVTNILEIYDPRLDIWSSGSSLPISLSAYTLAVFDGKLYLFGGWNGKDYLDNVYGYDPDQDIWTERPAMPTARAYAGSAVIGREIYVFGGFNGQHALAINEVFRPDLANGNNVWTEKAPMLENKYAMGGATLVEMIYVVGGIGSDNTELIAYQYQPMANQWIPVESPVSENIAKFGIAPLGANLFILGGIVGSVPTNQTMSYQAIYTVLLPLIR